MLTVERHPAAVIVKPGGVACKELFPVAVNGLSANVTIQTGSVVIEGFLAVVQYINHVIEPCFQLLPGGFVMAGRIGKGDGRQVVTAYVPFEVEAVVTPVGEFGMLLLPLVVAAVLVGAAAQPGLADKRSQQPVNIVFQQ